MSFGASPFGVRPLGTGSTTATGGATNTSVNPGAGSLTVTGQAPTVTQSANQSLSPGAGALTITGYVPSIAQPIAVSPGTGSMVITGFAPTISQPISVNPGVGSLALNGYAPTVQRTANQAVQPGAAALSLTGYAPTIGQTQITPCPPLYQVSILSQSAVYGSSTALSGKQYANSALQATLAIATIMAESRAYATAVPSTAIYAQASFV